MDALGKPGGKEPVLSLFEFEDFFALRNNYWYIVRVDSYHPYFGSEVTAIPQAADYLDYEGADRCSSTELLLVFTTLGNWRNPTSFNVTFANNS